MTDEIINFETAKLAKEKGFDIPCMDFIDIQEDKSLVMYYIGDTFEEKLLMAKEFILYFLPTQSLLQRWLRKVHNLNVNVNYYNDKITPIRWTVFIDTTYIPCKGITYEQALEEGLYNALNLIENLKIE